MKLSNVALTVFLFTSLNTFATEVSNSESVAACQLVADIIPTAYGQGLRVDACLRQFYFYVAKETQFSKSIIMNGRTAEDSITLCYVDLIKGSNHLDLAGPAPSCEMR